MRGDSTEQDARLRAKVRGHLWRILELCEEGVDVTGSISTLRFLNKVQGRVQDTLGSLSDTLARTE